MERRIESTLFKRVIAAAFKKCAIGNTSRDYACVVWQFKAQVWVARMVATPFGLLGSCIAWHRIAELLLGVSRKLSKLMINRYIDKLFGSDVLGVQIVAGQVFDMVCRSTGYHVDDAKSDQEKYKLVLLGMVMKLHFKQSQLVVYVPKMKAEKWRKCLLGILQNETCSSEEASKMAGRLNSIMSASMNRAGRAHMRAWYMQISNPMKNGRISPMLCIAMLCGWNIWKRDRHRRSM